MGALTAEQKTFIQNQLLALPHLQARAIWRELHQFFESVPSETCVRDFCTKFRRENAELVAMANSPDQWRRRYRRAYGTYAATHYGQRWEIDSTISDVRWDCEGRRLGILACVDTWSRQAKALIAETSNGTAIASLLRLCLLDWGVPDQIKSDNGKDYLSHHVLNLLRHLGIEHKACTPFNPQEKPYVERFNRTLQHSEEFLLHPRYLGNDIVSRQAIRARELFKEVPRGKKANTELEVRRISRTVREFQAFVDAAVERYNNTPHSGLPVILVDGKKRHMTPNERAATARHERADIADERALDVLLYPAAGNGGWRSLTGKQGVQIGLLPTGLPAYYHSPKLVALGQSCPRAYVKLDPVEGFAHLFGDEDCVDYLGLIECFDLTGGKRQPAIAAARAAEKTMRSEIAMARKEVRKHLRDSEAAVQPSNVVELRPGQAKPEPESHDTPALAAAGFAAQQAVNHLATATRFDEAPEPREPESAPANGFVELLESEVWPRVLAGYLAGDQGALPPREVAFVSTILSERAGKWLTWQAEAKQAGLEGDAWFDFVDWCLATEQALERAKEEVKAS